jgi:hypothetical protein
VRAIIWSDRALQTAEQLRLDEVFAMALITKAGALVSSGRFREGRALQTGAHADAKMRGLQMARLRSGVNLAATSVATDPRGSLEYTLEGMELARRLGMKSFAYYHATNLVSPALRLGEPDMVMAKLAELAEVDLDPLTLSVIEDGRAQVRRLRGEGGESRAALRIEAARAESDPQDLVNGYVMTMWESVADGKPGTAVEAARALLAEAPAFTGSDMRFDAGRTALHAGDLALATRALEMLGMGSGGASDGDLAALRGGVAALQGDVAGALAGYRAALATYGELGLRLDIALTGIDMASFLPGDSPDVVAAAAQARAILTDLDARPLLACLDALTLARVER